MVKNFKGKPLLSEIPPEESVSSGPMITQPRMEHTMEKYIASQVFNHKHSRMYTKTPVSIKNDIIYYTP